MPDDQDWQLIDRYLAGETSPEETSAVLARAKTDPAWARALDMLHSDFSASRATARDTDAAWSRLHARLSTERVANFASTRNASAAPLHARPWARMAAAILVIAGSFTAWQIISARRAGRPNAAEAFNEINTPNGTRQTVTLADGSNVTLNAGSRLRWAADVSTGSRDVYLDGEAYFSVTHDPARPFRVHARGTVAHDLGTRFTVRAYPELTHVEVVVAEGSVSLRLDRQASDSAILTTGQLGRLGQSGAPTVESNVPLDRWTAWTTGSLVLDGLTLADAIPQLERWYDVEITVADTRLAQRRISTRFHDETLPQMLDALTLALGARWQQSGRTVMLLPGVR